MSHLRSVRQATGYAVREARRNSFIYENAAKRQSASRRHTRRITPAAVIAWPRRERMKGEHSACA